MSTPANIASDVRLAAHQYAAAGLCVLPADKAAKHPTLVSWGDYQQTAPTPSDLDVLFHSASGLCLLCGAVSGNLEVLDFDFNADRLEAWKQLVSRTDPSLVDKLVIQRTQSGGAHVLYRCDEGVDRSTKLAKRWVPSDVPGRGQVGGKAVEFRNTPAGCGAVITLIETRGEGGLVLCAPTEGYTLLQGDLTALPVISGNQRNLLTQAAIELNEYVPVPPPTPSAPRAHSDAAGLRPGDDFNTTGDIRPVLQRAGWRCVRGGENEHWCRPGKQSGTSATLKNGVFYVFSSNAVPFEPETAYPPFAVLTLLEYNGDFIAAARALRDQGFGGQPHGSGSAMAAVAPDQPGEVRADPAAQAAAAKPEPPTAAMLSLYELACRYPNLREPVIDGVLRAGEIMNIIAPPKAGKSWLGLDLAIAVGTGALWLGLFKTRPGSVLIIDNELHPETSASRALTVAAAQSLTLKQIGEYVTLENLRGRLVDLPNMDDYFRSIEGKRFSLIILDAFYRFMPAESSENDNALITGLYNLLDRWAERLGCSFALIHHTSKGGQSDKSVTDVGAGAGSQARAADAHLVLRPHEEPGCVVLDAVVRSFKPFEPVALRFAFPRWHLASELDPTKLKSSSARGNRQRADEKVAVVSKPEWTPEAFAERFVQPTPEIKPAVIARARKAGLSIRLAEDLLDQCTESKLVFESREKPNSKARYCTEPFPVESASDEQEGDS